MAKHEYGMIVTTGELMAGAADATGNEIARSLTPQLGDLVKTVGKSLATMPGEAKNPTGEWEIVSHDITRIDRHLVTSFLLRREVAS